MVLATDAPHGLVSAQSRETTTKLPAHRRLTPAILAERSARGLPKRAPDAEDEE